MERRIGLRGRTDFGVKTHGGFLPRHARCVELSGTGIVLAYDRKQTEGDQRLLVELEITLPERASRITAWARLVRVSEHEQVLKFVDMNDADRLCLAEHLDLVYRRGETLH